MFLSHTSVARVWVFSICLASWMLLTGQAWSVEQNRSAWRDELLGGGSASTPLPTLELLEQSHEQLGLGRSILGSPLRLGEQVYPHGLGTHSDSHIRISSTEPVRRFEAWIGVDHNGRTEGRLGSVVFWIVADGREVFRSGVLTGAGPAERVALDLPGARTLDLRVGDAGDGRGWDHADWADAAVTLGDGRRVYLDELPPRGAQTASMECPFSFRYGDAPGRAAIEQWSIRREDLPDEPGISRRVTTWTDERTGLRVTCTHRRFADFPAADWVLHFENTGSEDTPIIADVQALDLWLNDPVHAGTPYALHRTHGGPANAQDFEPSLVPVKRGEPVVLNPRQGRSSHACFPFFKLDTARGAIIVAVGWSGTWQAAVDTPDDRWLRVSAGLEKTNFRLKPGEKVRTPRILVLAWEGDHWEANAQFRQLIYRHYAARRAGRPMLPMPFCNTCFTRGGGWLNECTADNQISLIRAYAPLGLEALLTDAGWFEGGWPSGAGNWNPRKDAYPQGMGPVAAAAKDAGMIYGLWFEPERVVASTDLHRNHPDWLLAAGDGPQSTYLLNFGLPEVQQYFFEIVKGFMDLPGFRVYRQDFNMDPLSIWRFNDAADRVGITEMKYIEGLYAFWDRIAEAWPDSLREECASGGNRIDLETVMRMHLHQKTDYWFDNVVDQASLWGLSQYLPNNTVVAHLSRMDTMSFHSTFPSSICLGWIADGPDFDRQRGQALMQTYLRYRHLLVGAWYPLLPYSRDSQDWIGSQYHRPDLDEGLLLLFRRAQSPYVTVQVQLRGMDPAARYELNVLGDPSSSPTQRASGHELMTSYPLTLDQRDSSRLIHYRKAEP